MRIKLFEIRTSQHPIHNFRVRRRSITSQTASCSPQWSLSFLYAVMVLARTAIVAAIPILALKFLGQVSYISTLYLSASLICLAFSLFLPKLISNIGLWRSLILAAVFGLISAGSFLPTISGFCPGLLFQFLMFTLLKALSIFIQPRLYHVAIYHSLNLAEYFFRLHIFNRAVAVRLGNPCRCSVGAHPSQWRLCRIGPFLAQDIDTVGRENSIHHKASHVEL